MQIELPENLWPLVAASGQLPWPPRTIDDAKLFVDHCWREGLLPILFAAPPPVDSVVAALQAYRALDAANRRRVATIESTITTLPELIGDEFALLKGADYAYRLYPSPELRPMGDIDVLVRHDRVAAVLARLGKAGFCRNPTRLPHFYPWCPDVAFDLGSILLEVHRSLIYRTRIRVDYEMLWRDRVPCTVAGTETWRLADCDALLVSVLNIAKGDLATPLVRYLDLWLMLRRNRDLATEAARGARRWRMVNGFDAVLRTLATMFPDLELATRSRPLFDRFIAPRDAATNRDRRRFRRPAQLWRKYWLIDGMDQRLGYLIEVTAANAWGAFHRKHLMPSRRR